MENLPNELLEMIGMFLDRIGRVKLSLVNTLFYELFRGDVKKTGAVAKKGFSVLARHWKIHYPTRKFKTWIKNNHPDILSEYLDENTFVGLYLCIGI